ncbi:hypothetical protein ABES02_07600 [Neobacillus pocheonensis]|uniref:hypothetical protein n=1 Tax=Neobacillus pocheonensis TaxID=363869 RepID=UPI003D2916CC
MKRKEGRWQTYRPFAWLGFFANFIFLTAAFLSVPVQQSIYPANELSTYISNVENASMRKIHPSGKEAFLDKNNLEKQIHNMNEKKVEGMKWYQEKEIRDEQSTKKRNGFLINWLEHHPSGEAV